MRREPTLHLGGTQHDDILDGLRGIAVLLVLGAHASWNSIALLGRTGVYLFFVLSAFLLTRQLCRAGFTGPVLGRYFVARIFRIYPLYALVIAYEAAVGYNLVDPMPAATAWRHLTLRDGQYVYWSITVEFQYYFALPLVAAAFVLLGQRRWPLLAAAFIAIGVAGVLGIGRDRLPGAIADHLYLYLPCFLAGSAAGAWATKGDLARVPRWFLPVGLAGIVVSLPDVAKPLLAAAGVDVPRIEDSRALPAIQGVFWTLVLAGCFHGSWRSAFELRWLMFYGRISFSLYLVHFLVWVPLCAELQVAAEAALGTAGTTLVAIYYVTASTIISYVTYRTVETPGIRLGRTVAARMFPLQGRIRGGPD